MCTSTIKEAFTKQTYQQNPPMSANNLIQKTPTNFVDSTPNRRSLNFNPTFPTRPRYYWWKYRTIRASFYTGIIRWWFDFVSRQQFVAEAISVIVVVLFTYFYLRYYSENIYILRIN